MKKGSNKKNKKKKVITNNMNKKDGKIIGTDKVNEQNQILVTKRRKNFVLFFIILICILSIGLVKKTLQNDTFYTIKIGELILDNGIDMMDHFSYHTNLAYTYPHWLYDVFIYLIYMVGGYTGLYISSMILLMILLGIVFKINRKITNNYSVSAFATFICALAISGFATARAQLVSFLIFALEVYFIEMFLKNGKKKYLIGLLLLSSIICNVHVAVWPFYFILYLPYLVEYLVSWIIEKINKKKEYKLVNLFSKKFVLEKNKNIKYIFIIMILSFATGLLTPIGDTPYTYMINMTLSNAQEYVTEHQVLSWANSPFTIIIAFETIFLSIISKVKLRDFFMICGLVLMSIISIRHLSFLALIGTICFCRLFSMFLESFNFDVDNLIIRFFSKKKVAIMSFILVIIASSLLFKFQVSQEYVASDLYPVDAVKYIKENIDIDEMRIFNEYNFGSYLLLNDIPVYIDSRADLYTKPFSGLDYDMFDDFYYMASNYQEKFDFYGITHILIYKNDDDLTLCSLLLNDENYKILYEDEYFVFLEKLGKSDFVITYK